MVVVLPVWRRHPFPFAKSTSIQHTKVDPMPQDKHSSDDHAHTPEGRALKNFALMALPWLSFQRDILSIMKKGVESASHVRPFEHLTLHELHAFMMIFDPTGRWRALSERDLEKTFRETYEKILPQWVSGSRAFIDAHEAVLESVSGVLNDVRKHPNSDTSKKPSEKSSR
jgi:hypothetical protein